MRSVAANLFLVLSSGHYQSLAQATAADQEKYPEFAKIANMYGYDWEPHTVETEDGWFLTLLRITGVDGEKFAKRNPEMVDKPPILMQHGATDSGFNWVQGVYDSVLEGEIPGAGRFLNGFGSALPGKLAERGYDVWMGNNRGTLYSNVKRSDDQEG